MNFNMKISTISLSQLDNLKGTMFLSCDQCEILFERKVKNVRACVKSNQATSFCSKKCKHIYSTKNNIKICNYCKNEYFSKDNKSKYCSKSCGNKNRKHSESTKELIAQTLYNRNPSNQPTKQLYKKSTNYCKIIRSTCRNCKFVGVYRKATIYCNDCYNCYTNLKSKFAFSFNIFDFPDIFDYSIIEQYGWFSTIEPLNLNGVSRDHKVSVFDAIFNNYDPYYICHPLNCELIRQTENASKGKKSSISYNELVELIDLYDSQKLLN